MGFTHWTLDVESSDVLPVLLQQGNQKVDWQQGVRCNFIDGHVNVSDGDGQAQDLIIIKSIKFIV